MRASSLSAHIEKAQALRDLDAEVIIAIGAVVNAGPRAEEVHSEYPIHDGDGSEYLAKLFEGVLLRLAHDYGAGFALFIRLDFHTSKKAC